MKPFVAFIHLSSTKQQLLCIEQDIFLIPLNIEALLCKLSFKAFVMDTNFQAAVGLAEWLLSHVAIPSLKTIQNYEVQVITLLKRIPVCSISGNFWSLPLIIGKELHLGINKHQILNDKLLCFRRASKQL